MSPTAADAALETRADTKELLLDAAERLCAEHGVAGASMRGITALAGVNVAAANYHFGSKEALVRAMISRRLGPLNRERLRLLDAAEAAGEPTLEALVRAFVGPFVVFGRDLPDHGRHFAALCGRAMSSPDATLRTYLVAELGEVVARFSAAFFRALPHLSPADVLWRLHFMVGSMAHTLAGGEVIRAVTAGRCDPDDREALLERLVAFLRGGLAAPAPEPTP